MGGLAEQLGGWEVQILLLSSLLLQVLLLVFTEWRRRASRWALLSASLNGILWLLYQLADSVAIYVLGHMALSCKPREQQQLMAFWASLLLVHLGGQDTITAYAMEDNDLWLRHLFTLVVQAAGAAYVLCKYVASGALLVASVLMFLVGVVKYGERIYALKSSGLDSIRKFLDGLEVPESERGKEYPAPTSPYDPEEVLQGAHDLLHICMGQLVDYRVWPSRFQIRAIAAYHGDGGTNPNAGRSMLPQLVGMQLSLMRDILYTKAIVIGPWYGCMSRIVFIFAIIMAFHLFQAYTSMGGGRGYGGRDMVVTYILLGGALLLEVVSLLRTAMSTWTCAWLGASSGSIGKQLHKAVVCVRRGVKAAERCRKWPGSIGQHDIFQLHRYRRRSKCYVWMACFGLGQRWSRVRFFGSAVVIPHDVEKLVVKEMQRMVEAYARNNPILSGPGQLPLGRWGINGAGAELYAGVVGVEEAGFDGNILAWHYATDVFLRTRDVNVPSRQERANMIGTLSRYMVFLLVERPHLLPSPVRRSQYDSFCDKFEEFSDNRRQPQLQGVDIRPEVQLANNMLDMRDAQPPGQGVDKVLRVISRVWVEMLCYAASHCSNDSHARQLSSGTEFITLTWILTTALYNRHQRGNSQVRSIGQHFHERHQRRRDRRQEALLILAA